MRMKNTFIKHFALILAVAITLSLSSCSLPEGIARYIPWLDSEKEEIIDDTMNGYIIVRSDSAGTEELEISKLIRDAMDGLGCTDTEIKTDFAGKDNPPAKEILVGDTNREKVIDTSAFKDSDYEIKGVEHKIYIAAKTEKALRTAAEYFSTELLPSLVEGTLLCADVHYKYDHEYPIRSAFVGNTPLEECVIAVGEELTLIEREAVQKLSDTVYELSGTRLEILPESDERVAGAKGLIVFGGKSENVKSLGLITPENGFAIKSFGDTLAAASNVRYGILKAVNEVYKAFFSPESLEQMKDGRCDILLAENVTGEFDYETYLTENAKPLELGKTTSKTEIVGMTTENRKNPVGIDTDTPRFEWCYSTPDGIRGDKQLSYRIAVATSPDMLASGEPDVWDSGYVDSSDTFALIPLTEKEVSLEDGEEGEETEENEENEAPLVGRLAMSSRYYWQVTAKTAMSGEIRSGIAFFETGLMSGGMNDALWICADEYYCTDTVGRVEAKFTLGKNAAGVSFGFSEDESSYYMWQFNTSNKGYAVLRPHIYRDGAWSYLPEVSLKDMFPTAEDASKNPVTMSIKINDGVITTYINGKLVSTNTVEPFAIGKVRERLSGGESAEYEYIRILDESDGVLYGGESASMPMYRYDFVTKNDIVGARLYASALGVYDVYLNGKRLGDTLLSPGRTAYNEKIYYETYDVTDLISEKNAIAATVGNGWYNSSIVGGSYGDKNAFIAKLVLIHEDGTEEIFTTGDGWKYSSTGPVTKADFYEGEHYDARLEKSDMSRYGGCPDWKNAKVCTSTGMLMQGAFSPGVLTADTTEPVRAVTAYRPIAVTNPEEGVYVYDFGQNMAGVVSATMTAESGAAATFTYGEVLSPETGKPDIGYMLGHNGTDVYTFRGDSEGETFFPTLVYHGFRYVMVEGLAEEIPEGNITAYAITNDTERTGSFESSNVLLNRYYENTLMSQRSNFISNITDCPTREKNGWTGDAQVFAKTAAFNADVRSIYGNFLEMMRMSMSDDGAVPEIIPSRGTSNTTKTPAGWSDAIVTIPYELYMQYGNKAVLSENYDSMKLWIAFLMKYKLSPNDGDYIRKDGNYGDHLAYNNGRDTAQYNEKEYGNSKDTVKRETSYSEIATAYTAYSCLLIAEVADILEIPNEAEYYRELSEKFKTAWRENFVEADGFTSKANSQTSYVMGLYFDMYESPEKKKSALGKLCELIDSADGCQTVGFIGMNMILDVLSDGGRTDVAYKLLLNTKAPSLLYPVTQDATTTWESYTGGSRNHFVQGSPVRWLYTDILGIDHDRVHSNAGYRHFSLSPKPMSLEYAKGAYKSVNGVIKSSWTRTENGYTYECTVPVNTTATLTLPISANAEITESGKRVEDGITGAVMTSKNGEKAVFELESGSFSFTVSYAE